MKFNYMTNITIIILTYNNIKDIKTCLSSITKQTYPHYSVIVVDNLSTDGTVEYIQKAFPYVRIIQTGENLGYAAGNNVGIERVDSNSDYIAILNPDTEVDKNWLHELVQALEMNPKAGLATSRILLYDERDTVNTCGNYEHFAGLAFCNGLNDNSSNHNTQVLTAGVSGCSFLARRNALEKLKGFDPDFFMYHEDVDLSWRARRAGYDILYVPESIVYHKYKLSLKPWKYFYMERNRYLLLLKNCSVKYLILAAPSILLTECIAIGYASLNGFGYIKNKLRAYIWIIRNIDIIAKKRSETIIHQATQENDFFTLLEWRIPFEQVIENKFLRQVCDATFNLFFKINYIILRRLL